IIDVVNGGVGFRNHTVPTNPRMKYGATWTEDLLWIEPVTACVDTNWTIKSLPQTETVSPYPNSGLKHLLFVNKGGGFVPKDNPDFVPLDATNMQENPDLERRAHLAASMFNYRLSSLLKLVPSNSSTGLVYDITEGEPLYSSF